ncbi:cyclic pyranopterin monophosphate synthase MoaC [Acidisarcina polymorpha]|nr:cyclic pyranopterin monophosphate synthase MoaC [Acidisarcina polymorpha]
MESSLSREPKLSHLRSDGSVRMVDVSGKGDTLREAEAQAMVRLGRAALRALRDNPKGDVLEVARIAGIMAAKRTAELIPLCHNLPLTGIDVEVSVRGTLVRIRGRVRTTAGTGVEMEALTAVTVAALTVYDMCKAAGHGITIEQICLLKKSGGRSGTYVKKSAPRRAKG